MIGGRGVRGAATASGGVGGGAPAAKPNPSRILGVDQALNMKGKVINLPCCPVNPEWLIGTVVYITTMGKVPELDGKGRPKMVYGRKIHDNRPRRTPLDGGRVGG